MKSHDFFAGTDRSNSSWFDEGPPVIIKLQNVINSSSLNTLPIDPYRQGVELTQIKHFDAGMVKIHAGEPGHIIRQTYFGESEFIDLSPTKFVEDYDTINPVEFLSTHRTESSSVLIAIAGRKTKDRLMDGVIEPFALITHKKYTNNTSKPFYKASSFRGSVQSGNSNVIDGSDLILSIDYYNISSSVAPYIDNNENPILDLSLQHAKINMFSDTKYIRNANTSSLGNDIDSALSNMTGSTENYVTLKQKSGATGWYTDINSFAGVDSLAFGGLTY